MFLPGISGAYILLVLGQYEFMLNVIRNLKNSLDYFLVFILGAVIGALTISKIISFLFRRHHSKTLYILFGLVLGSLATPIKQVFNSSFVFDLPNILYITVLLIMGIITVVVINKMAEKVYKKDFITIEK